MIRIKSKLVAISASALATVIMHGPAFAQNVSASTQSEVESTNSGFDEIVVSARKRDESAQDTPVSISVATGDDLADRGITKFNDLEQAVPGLRLSQSQSSSSTSVVSLRGMSAVDARITGDTAVGVYVDGIYYPHAYGLAVGNFWDVGRVEVLKGPQGTLYGRNTTGGAVSVYTKGPSDQFEGEVKTRFGNYAQYGMSGVVNIPLSPTLATRIAAEAHGHDGYGKNLFNGRDLGKEDGWFVRMSTKWTPTPEFTAILRADYGKIDFVPNAFKAGIAFNSTDPIPGGGFFGNSGFRAIATELGLLPATLQANINTATNVFKSYAQGNKNDGNLNVQPFDNIRIYGGSLNLNFDVSDAVSLRSITGYRNVNRVGALDNDGTPFSLFEFASSRTNLWQFSQESQVYGEAFGNRLNYLFGVYYSIEKGYDYFESVITRAINTTTPNIQFGNVVNKTIGYFGQATFKITDGLNATGGLRYSKDTRSLDSHNRNPTICIALGTPLATTPDCSAKFDASFSAWQWTAGLDYSPTPGLMVYAKADKGYRTGVIPLFGGSTTPTGAAATFTPVNPEFVKSYEAGFKVEFLDRRARLNVTYYHTDFDNIQISRSITIPGIGNVAVQQNGAKAKVDGVELEAAIKPIPQLELNATLAYTDSRFTDYVSGVVNLKGFPLVGSPKWAYSLAATFTQPISVGELRLNADYSHRSWQYISLPAGSTEAYGLLNGRISLTLDNPGMDVSIFGKNILNRRVANYAGSTASQGFIYSGPYTDPATYGVEIGFKF